MVRPPATTLPEVYGEMLRRAAMTPNTRANPTARDEAIAEAIERVKKDFPQFFNNKESDDEDVT